MFGFSDLEDRLFGPEGKSVLASALEAVRGMAQSLNESIAAGLPEAEFERARKILAATGAAERILLNAAHLKGA